VKLSSLSPTPFYWGRSGPSRCLFSLVGYVVLGITLLSGCAVAQTPREELRNKILTGVPVDLQGRSDEDHTIDASWIEEAVRKGAAIAISGAMIKGALTLVNATFDKDFILANCVLTDDADLSYSVFKQNVQMRQTKFKKTVFFRGATFYQRVTLDAIVVEGAEADFQDIEARGVFSAVGAKFIGVAGFDHARFERTAYFNQDKFLSDSDFIGTQFGDECFFGAAEFRKPARFWHTHFAGNANFNLNLDSKKYAAIFAADAGFDEARFEADAIFGNVTFRQESNFTSMTVAGTAIFRAADFRGNAFFLGTVVNGDSDFSGSHFYGLAIFNHAELKRGALFRPWKASPVTFEMLADFTAAQFEGNAEFDQAQIHSAFTFEHAEVSGRTTFRSAKFTSSIKPTFRGSSFHEEAWFQSVNFSSGANFSGVQLRSETRFSGAIFGSDSFFTSAHFFGFAEFGRDINLMGASALPGASFQKVDFDHARFDDDANFAETKFWGNTSFRAASFRTVYFATGDTKLLPDDQFAGELDLRGTTYDRIETHWSSLLRTRDGQSRIKPYDREPFVQLETVLRKVGAEEEANAVYLERRRVEHDSLSGTAWLFDQIYKLVGNFGNDLWNELRIALCILALGTIIFSRDGAVTLRESDTEPFKLNLWSALWLSIHEFLPVALPMKPTCEPSRRRIALPWPGRKPFELCTFSSYANFLGASGFVLVPLAVVALTGLLRHVGP
jgi:hypothetical protein